MSAKIPVIVTNSGVRLWVDPASVKVPDRRRNSRLLDECFVLEYAIDLDSTAAAARCGITRNPGRAGMALFKRNERRIAAEFQARAIRLQIDADFVLSELMRQYVRLTGMLGHDMACLYTENGGLKPVTEWPAVWREKLVTEMETREITIGAGDDAEPATLTRLKRETALSIEKQIRETLRLIGEHTKVKAFPRAETETLGKVTINVVYAEVPAVRVLPSGVK